MQIDLIAEAITEYWGDRCPDFDADCPCCKAWKQFDALSTLQGAEQKPACCVKCGRPISEHWDFPAVCERFTLTKGDAAAIRALKSAERQP